MTNLVVVPSIFQQFFDADGFPLTGGKLYTYQSKTNIKVDTFKDSEANSLNENPIILDANGMCRIFIQNTTVEEGEDPIGYRFELFDKNDVLIRTEDNIFAISGVDGKNTGRVVVGPPGDVGPEGKSIQGKTGKTGDVGPIGKGGKTEVMYRTAGSYVYTVEKGVSKINVIQLAGGGGFLNQNSVAVGRVTSGRAGEMATYDINVSEGDNITIVVGAGGKASTIQSEVNGKNTTVNHSSIGTKTTLGGQSGYSNSPIDFANSFQTMTPFLNEKTFSGQYITVIPRAISGEGTKFGQGGDVYKTGSPNATGNGSSGGSGIPVLSGTTITVSSFGAGADGLVILSFNKDES